jgi:protein SCO1/2
MVSLDPERDQLPQLQAYTAFFHPAMTGISGTSAEIGRIAGNFGVRYSKQTPKADGSYVVDHTAATYVVGPDGKLAAVLDLGTPSETVVTTIRQLL